MCDRHRTYDQLTTGSNREGEPARHHRNDAQSSPRHLPSPVGAATQAYTVAEWRDLHRPLFEQPPVTLSYGQGRIASMIGRWHGLVIDCPEPGALAAFYQKLLGMQRVQDEGTFVVIGDAADRPGVAFQQIPDLRMPQWGDPDRPQQMHLDVRVDDLDEAEERVLGLGARRLPGGGERFRVYADPAGHPFCLVRW